MRTWKTSPGALRGSRSGRTGPGPLRAVRRSRGRLGLRVAAAAALAVAPWPLAAVEHVVGPGRPLTEIEHVPWESLVAGDVVTIHARPQAYRAKWVLCARGTADQPILIRGVADAGGRLPVIDGADARTRSGLDFWGEERGVIKIGGANRPADLMPAHIVIESLAITGGRPPHRFIGRRGDTAYATNAAAVFIEKGESITLRGCVLSGCGNGLFVSPQSRRVTIEGCHIHANGIEGSILEHNAYTQSRSIDYRFNRFGPLRPGCRGNNLKDRSAETLVRANWIEGGNRALDLVDGDWTAGPDGPPPQRTIVVGNVLVRLDEEANNQVVHYGGDSGRLEQYRTATLWFVHNTVVSLRPGTTTLVRLSSPQQRAECRGTIVFTTAPGRSLAIFAGEGVVSLRDNWLMTGWRETLSAGAGRVILAARGPEGEEPGFVDRAASDYRLKPGSACNGLTSPLPAEAWPGGLPAVARPAADAARVPLAADGRFPSLGAAVVLPPDGGPRWP